MIKNYLHHNGKTYYRGTYKTFEMAEKWGKIDLKRHANKYQYLNGVMQLASIVKTIDRRRTA
jgi:hypothetical protein